MKTYEIDGTFLVRADKAENWNLTTLEGKGANRVLKKGEIGWIVGTSDFKIGDGTTPWKDLDFIIPVGEHSPYALKLGDGTDTNYYTYASLKAILDNLEIKGEEIESLSSDVTKLKEEVKTLNQNKTLFYSSRADFPGIGVQGPFYVDKSTDDVYYFNIDTYEGKPLGYMKIAGFDILQAKL